MNAKTTLIVCLLLTASPLVLPAVQAGADADGRTAATHSEGEMPCVHLKPAEPSDPVDVSNCESEP